MLDGFLTYRFALNLLADDMRKFDHFIKIALSVMPPGCKLASSHSSTSMLSTRWNRLETYSPRLSVCQKTVLIFL